LAKLDKSVETAKHSWSLGLCALQIHGHVQVSTQADACAGFAAGDGQRTDDKEHITLLQWVNDAPSDLFRDRLDHLEQNSLSNRPWIGHNGL
jgi:hypothetical protein